MLFAEVLIWFSKTWFGRFTFVHEETNQNQMARSHHTTVLENGQKNGAIQNIKLGHVYIENNQIETAIQHYNKALEIAREREDKQYQTNAYIWLGCAYKENNQIQTAIGYYEKAAAMERSIKNKANIYIWLGNSYEKNDQIHNAIDCYEKALELARKRKYRTVEATCAYEENNQIQTAITHYKKALKIAIQQKNKKTTVMAQHATDRLQSGGKCRSINR